MVLGRLVRSILETPEKFAEVAMHDPISALLVVVGAVIVLASLGVFGLLVAGAGLDLIRPETAGETYPRDR
ncbi:MAG: hypothetical protein V5A55_08775 [Halovenus sp.]